MHFEILVEDRSGKAALEIIIPKILNEQHTFKIHSYKGIGRIPPGLEKSSDPKKRILLDRLPRLIQGFGKTFSSYPPDYSAALIVICDLDRRCLKDFRKELFDCVGRCQVKLTICFCIAIEEGEAWYLGDIKAIKTAYPKAKDAILNAYVNDEICDTWEKLADALYKGGSKSLSKQGYQAIGKEKTAWAMNISLHLDVENNQSPSFCYFRDKLRMLSSA